MSHRIHYPLDPDCPTVLNFLLRADDPMMRQSGCWDEFLEDFERTHGRGCPRCRDFGCANVEVL